MKKIILNLIAASFIFTVLVVPVLTLGITPQGPSENINIPGVFETIVNWAFYFLLVISAFFLIIAGFYFVTAQGDPEQIKKARNMVLYALIGLAVAVLSRAIVSWLQGIIEGR